MAARGRFIVMASASLIFIFAIGMMSGMCAEPVVTNAELDALLRDGGFRPYDCLADQHCVMCFPYWSRALPMEADEFSLHEVRRHWQEAKEKALIREKLT